jgi:hypothetical protein
MAEKRNKERPEDEIPVQAEEAKVVNDADQEVVDASTAQSVNETEARPGGEIIPGRSFTNPTRSLDQPVVTMDIRDDPYQLPGTVGLSGGAGVAPRINISSIVGADLTRLELPQMLEVLRGVYERKGTKLVYRPRAFRARSQAGTLSDIQASLYKRFQEGQEEINHLLDLLTPLKTDADKEVCDAVRELVRDDVNELVQDAGWLGGPRIVKIGKVFDSLNQNLGNMGLLLGITDGPATSINTQAEAETADRFFTINEIVVAMKAAFDARIGLLDRSSGESFGNQVIWLSRCLETVKEITVRFKIQLRARLVGESELATKKISQQGGLTLAELFDWTIEVCDKGVVISSKAGRIGMHSLADDLLQLRDIYALLRANPDVLEIPALKDAQVMDTLASLVNSLEDAAAFARGGFGNDLKKVD